MGVGWGVVYGFPFISSPSLSARLHSTDIWPHWNPSAQIWIDYMVYRGAGLWRNPDSVYCTYSAIHNTSTEMEFLNAILVEVSGHKLGSS